MDDDTAVSSGGCIHGMGDEPTTPAVVREGVLTRPDGVELIALSCFGTRGVRVQDNSGIPATAGQAGVAKIFRATKRLGCACSSLREAQLSDESVSSGALVRTRCHRIYRLDWPWRNSALPAHETTSPRSSRGQPRAGLASATLSRTEKFSHVSHTHTCTHPESPG